MHPKDGWSHGGQGAGGRSASHMWEDEGFTLTQEMAHMCLDGLPFGKGGDPSGTQTWPFCQRLVRS